MANVATVTLSGQQVADRIESAAPGAVAEVTAGFVVLAPDRALEAMRIIRDDAVLDGKYLAQVCSVDMITRIDVVYHFSSLAQNHIFEVKVPADHEQPVVPSITPLWIGAWLQEREIYDMMGVHFEGHPSLTRLLLWDAFPGHPLRKDFMALPGGQKAGLSHFPKQVPGESGQEFRPKHPGTGA
jgi:NADH-quinone oxidoreductase subunit C